MTEHAIQNECLALLAILGCWRIRVNSGAVRATNEAGRERFFRFNSEKGCSDILGALPASHGTRLLAVEVKRPGKSPTALQRSFLDTVAAAGGLALVVHSAAELADYLALEGVGL